MKDIDRHVQEVLTALLQVPAPPGREEKIASLVRAYVKDSGFETETDAAGNVLVRIPAASNNETPPTVLAAHMDEIAMVVSRIEDNGNLCVFPSGGLTPHKLGECAVEIVADEDQNVLGVFSIEKLGTEPKQAKLDPEWNHVRIKTGLSPAQLQARGVRIGSSAVPVKDSRGPHILGDESDPMIAGWTLDDRGGVATLLTVLCLIAEQKIKPQWPLIIAFTVHEEGGCHGAKVLARREMPEIFIAVDGSQVTEDVPLELDGRPGIWSKDTLANYDQQLLKELMRAARTVGTELQPAVYTAINSDASAVYNAGLAPRVGFVGHVRENAHGYEWARLSVFRNTVNTLLVYIKG